MDNMLKSFLIAAGVIITCIIIGVGFFITKQTKTTSNNSTGQINTMYSQYNDIELATYDDALISGADVINLINDKKDDPIFINVKTKGSISENWCLLYTCTEREWEPR